MLPDYFYHGVRFEHVHSALEVGLQPYERLNEIKPLTMNQVNVCAWRYGIYLSDFMALPYAWNLSFPDERQDSPGIVTRISKEQINEDLLRPGQGFLMKHLEKIKDSKYMDCFKPYQEGLDRGANRENVARMFVDGFIDSYAHLWKVSLDKTGEALYRGGFAPSEFEYAVPPPIPPELFKHNLEVDEKERAAHLAILQSLDFKEAGNYPDMDQAM